MSHPEPEESNPLSPILFLYVQFPLLGSFQKPHPNPRHCITLCSTLTLFGKELFTPKMEDHPLLAVLQLPQLQSSWETPVYMLTVQNFELMKQIKFFTDECSNVGMLNCVNW
jgi:hypothetical protein